MFSAAIASRSRKARPGVVPSSSSRPDRSMVEGAMCSRGTAVGTTASRKRRFADQHVIGRAVAVAAIDAEPGRGVALRIEIDDQHALADRGQRRAEIDRGGGLADAALLVGERQDARMAVRSWRPILLINLDQLRSCAVAMCCRGRDCAARSGRVRRSSHVRRCGWNEDCGLIFQYLVASVNSASTSWPLRNSAFAPLSHQRLRKADELM